jgi:hypothetical protein
VSTTQRLSRDPAAPRWLRDALQEAADERASPEALKRVLGASAIGVGATALAAKAAGRATPLASTLLRASVLTKGAVAVAIFMAGSVAGGYAVHEHDVRQAGLVASSPGPLPQVLPASPAPTIIDPASLAPTGEVSSAAAAPETPRVRAARPAEAPSPVAARTAQGQASRAPSPVTPDAPALPDVPPAAPVGPSWRDQLAGLRAIRDAAGDDRHGDALAAIDEYRRRFPAPVFDQELLFLEAQARWARGDHAACGILDRLTASYPTSLLVPRARALGASAGCSSPKR